MGKTKEDESEKIKGNMGNIHTTGPNKALIISGGCFKGQSKKIVVGSWAWSWWYVTNVQYLNLNLMTIEPCCYDVETALGVPLSVTGVAHCKILRNPDLMMLATEQFLGKEEKEVRNTILQTLEGHLCAMHAKFETAIKIEEYKRAYNLQVAEFEKEVNMAKAQAQFAYQLEVAKL